MTSQPPTPPGGEAGGTPPQPMPPQPSAVPPSPPQPPQFGAPLGGSQPPAPPGYAGAPAGYAGVDPSAPWGRHPISGEPYSDKSKIVAGLLELFLGWVGAGRWYLGNTGIALGQLFTCGGLGIWSLIDAIMMLTGNVRDQYGRPLRD